MKPEIKELWLAALRSGEYTHARRYLKTRDADGLIYHCVLGVLCDIHSKQTDTSWDTAQDYFCSDGTFRISYQGMRSSLSDALCEWAGVQDGLVHFHTDDGTSTRLAVLNDNSGSYKESIEAIERYL